MACNTTRLPCTYAFVATHSYFPGLAVMLHSLAHHNAQQDDCGAVRLLWHPEMSDTMLSAVEKAALARLVPCYRLHYHRVDDERFYKWAGIRPTYPAVIARTSYTSTMMNLEAFYFRSTAGVVLRFDADMLAIRPLPLRSIIDASLRDLEHVPAQDGDGGSSSPAAARRRLSSRGARPETFSWRLHCSDSEWKGDYKTNLGAAFYTFATPVPTLLTDAMFRLTNLTAGTPGPPAADQDFIRMLVNRPSKWRAKDAAPLPYLLRQHKWLVNIWPPPFVNETDAQGVVWHWGGVPKPWVGGRTAFMPNPMCHASCYGTWTKAAEVWRTACERARARLEEVAAQAEVRTQQEDVRTLLRCPPPGEIKINGKWGTTRTGR